METRKRVALAEAAMGCTDIPRRANDKHYFPGEILAMARAVIVALDQAAFALWRDKCRAELVLLGEMKVGQCVDGRLLCGVSRISDP
jgi:hypothetical protein